MHDILFSDEAQFTHDGITNTRNLHSWAHESPHKLAECNFQHRFSAEVLCGVLGNNLIGPHVIDIHLTAQYCRKYWKQIQANFDDVPLAA
jgi:hypothetical protein